MQPSDDEPSGTETKTSAYVETLQAYKKLTLDPDNHQRLLNDKTVLLLIAYLLDSSDDEILHLCLDILFDFLIDCDARTQHAMTSVLGLLEALHCLKAKPLPPKILQEVSFILNTLETTQRPIRNPKKYKVYNLYLPGLSKELRARYEESLVGIRGIVSFVIDMASNCCMLRISASQRIQDIVRSITDKTGSTPMLVIINATGRKEYVASCDTTELKLEYTQPESFIEAPLSFFRNTLTHTKSTFQKLRDTVDNYFYW